MHYELWDLQSANLLGEYDTEAEALAVVSDALALHGMAAIAPLALGAEHDDEGGDDATLPPIVRGSELAARAQATKPERRQLPA